VLLVDDVNDSGKTLSAAFDLLKDAKTAKTAVIHQKKDTEFSADFVGENIEEWRWLIYQWAAAEDVLDFLKEGNMLNADMNEAKRFLAERYNLQIEESLLKNILSVKGRYM
jgi:hypoxanthine phosphoribosyltransferase